jgi:hypothetical protein
MELFFSNRWRPVFKMKMLRRMRLLGRRGSACGDVSFVIFAANKCQNTGSNFLPAQQRFLSLFLRSEREIISTAIQSVKMF